MKIGMIWHDTKDDLLTRVSRAVVYYEQKYKQTANTCYVNPAMLQSLNCNGPTTTVQPLGCNHAITIIATNHILINDFWIGHEDAEQMLTDN